MQRSHKSMLSEFLKTFIPQVALKAKEINQAAWLLETTGSSDAATLKCSLEGELQTLLSDEKAFQMLVSFQEQEPLLLREQDVLIRLFKPQMIPKELSLAILKTESELALIDAQFRATLDGKQVSENAIRAVLKKEKSLPKRWKAFEASKQCGKVRAPLILKLVNLRNQAATHLGYSDYFSMRLALEEVDEKWLFSLFQQVYEESEAAYRDVERDILAWAKEQYGFQEKQMAPHLFSEPFAQEDPIGMEALDALVAKVDLLESAEAFYAKMGFEIKEILQKSDHFERPSKNPHAFCMHLDREGDIRILNNLKPTLKWLETLLHELGHAVYDQGISQKLPWLLKEPPHMATTEAIALLMGRQAYRKKSLDVLVGKGHEELKSKAEHSLKRRQLIFARFVLVMTAFEKELYKNPEQDLNQLWWKLVLRYQKIASSGSGIGFDFATKYHIGGAPVYYYSYLVGELFASFLEETCDPIVSLETGAFLKEKIFAPGNTKPWRTLMGEVMQGWELGQAWRKEFTTPLAK